MGLLNYPPKTIILPKKFMKEYKLISNMEHIQDMFSGYDIIEKEVFINPTQDIKNGEKIMLVENNTKIPLMLTNTFNLAGLIIEKEYYCLFVEVFATNSKTKKQMRAGVFLTVIRDEHIIKVMDCKEKLKIETMWGNNYVLSYFNFKEQLITTIILDANIKPNKKVMQWYVSAISQFLDIWGLSLTPPSRWKPAARDELFCWHKWKNYQYTKNNSEGFEIRTLDSKETVPLQIIQRCEKCGKKREKGIILLTNKQFKDLKDGKL